MSVKGPDCQPAIVNDICATAVLITSRATICLLSLVKSEQTWLRLQELKFEGIKYLCCVHIDKTTTRSMQMEVLAHLLHFQIDFCLRLRSPVNQESHIAAK